MILRSLHPDARRLVTAEFVSGQLERWPERAYVDLLSETSGELQLDELDSVLDRAIDTTERYDPTLDQQIAPQVHRAIPLSRRQARDSSIWRFLTVIHRPDFVRHRWENRALTTMKSRFWSFGTRPDSNALARLWWIAELTRNGTDYRLTTRVLNRGPLATSLFVRDLCWYRPAVHACVEGLEDASTAVIEATMRRLTKVLSTVLLETRNETQLRQLVDQLRRRAE